MAATILAPDGKARCRWCAAAPEFLSYHDNEWSFPVDDDHRLFEKLCLEGFQSDLSWRTILAKRENFRSAFLGFDFDRIAPFTDTDIERLLQNAGIVRHGGKIAAVVNNAQRAQELVRQEGSLPLMSGASNRKQASLRRRKRRPSRPPPAQCRKTSRSEGGPSLVPPPFTRSCRPWA